ncbi:peptidoglycan DD-metalloendopeptidase family protein [Desulfatitalea alkaliphila]|uniref:Peptidoglycan DD-metalloendopeptidase family protein n=1 Tax=Desulfatitalea alkaliphila TaxID=2929485 RepID=A0AA41R2W4_9BACT|nr:peptidoglycan DD-metalloendopeptidase family protein [Desulfatitalea alkaliphila]MCJ8501174.1 peptidoglycan DD-metalloendopeptidase family protein [Desulfatitalea alkaliphila]
MTPLRLFMLALVALLLLASPPRQDAAAEQATEVGTILVSNLNVRSGPGRSHRVVMRLPAETRVRVLGRDSGWLKIEHGGRSGYILHDERYVRIAVIAAPAPAADRTAAPDPEKRKALRAKADELQKKLQASAARIGTMSDQEQALVDAVDAAEKALDDARRQVRETRTALAALEEKRASAQQEQTALQEAIRSGEAYAAQRLVALYKLQQVGRAHLLASADSFFDFVDRKRSLEQILDQDEALLRQLNNDHARLAAVVQQIQSARAEQRALNEALDQRIARLAAEQENRSALLRKVRGAKSLEQAAHKALQQATRDLDGALAALGPTPSVQRPAARATDQPATGGGPFAQSKGLLNWPVRGKIITFFGPYRDEKADLVNFHSGINIQADRGEPIRAVADGYAIYASWFKGFGNMLIIDHGDHYYTVYAHLEEVFKVKGDRIETGEVIATVGDTGSLMGPALHFQVRHHGKPVDPLEWMNKG